MEEKYTSVMPPLTDAEYEALKADIEKRGVLVPIEYCIEEDGTLILLDGFHRLKICKELKIIDYPTVVRANLGTHEERMAYARQINLLRRQITMEQRAELIKAQLRDTPEYSDRALAGMLGVSDKTIGVYRKELESTAEIPQLKVRKGKDGKARPIEIRKPVTVFNPTEKQIRLLSDDSVVERMSEGKHKSPVVAARRIKKEELDARKGSHYDLQPEDFQFFNKDLRDGLLEIPDESLDLIFCDPPYSADYIDLYAEIAKIAKRTLKPEGSLLVMTGGKWLPQALQGLCSVEDLFYWWTLCYITERQSTHLQWLNLSTYWRPIIHMVKKNYTGDIYSDLIKTPPNDGEDKEFTKLGANLDSMEKLIYAFTDSGDTVADFCMGGGTTGVACVRLGRKFIGVEVEEEMFDTAKQRILKEYWPK